MDDPNQPQPAQAQPAVTSTGGATEVSTDEKGDKVFRIGKYNVKVIRAECIGAATCIAVSPNVYELDGENKAVVKPGSTDTDDNLIMAAQSCPTKAIVVTDATTGALVWPQG